MPIKNTPFVLPLLALAACGSDDSAPTPENSASAPAIAATVNEAAEDKAEAEESAERLVAAERRGEGMANSTIRADQGNARAAQNATDVTTPFAGD